MIIRILFSGLKIAFIAADNCWQTTVNGPQPTQLNLKRYSFSFKGRYCLVFNPGGISVKKFALMGSKPEFRFNLLSTLDCGPLSKWPQSTVHSSPNWTSTDVSFVIGNKLENHKKLA